MKSQPMKRRITTAIVGVTAFVLLALGIPLAVIAERSILDSEVVELHVAAAETLTEINLPIDPAELAALAFEPDAPPPFAIYDNAGTLVYGVGPPEADAAVVAATRGSTSSTTEGLIVVATPITDENETVVAVLRLSESLAGAESRARLAWLSMAAAGAVAIGTAWLIARRVARRLSRPVTDLAIAASQLGHGGVLGHHEPVGVNEIDLLAATLADGSQRVNEALARERRFSADVSHQLRTPLAGLRLKLELALESDQSRAITSSALGDLERIEETVAHLLAFARDAIPASSTSALDEAVESSTIRWAGRAVRQSRTITTDEIAHITVRASRASVDQILDVLIDNALTHGDGTITLTARTITGGAAIDVTDEGSSLLAGTEDELFRRGHGTNNGIGLALARSIAEAEGGRLLVTHRQPTTFSLILLDADE